jgi:hypothetical protein
MSGKHAETRPAERPHDSAEVDPGIGRSKGTTISGQDPRLIEGESPFPGDVENETNAQGGIDLDRTGRTNR